MITMCVDTTNLQRIGDSFSGHYHLDGHGIFSSNGINTPEEMADVLAERFDIDLNSQLMDELEDICWEISSSQAVFNVNINDADELSYYVAGYGVAS